jgi:hypothetical protein
VAFYIQNRLIRLTCLRLCPPTKKHRHSHGDGIGWEYKFVVVVFPPSAAVIQPNLEAIAYLLQFNGQSIQYKRQHQRGDKTSKQISILLLRNGNDRPLLQHAQAPRQGQGDGVVDAESHHELRVFVRVSEFGVRRRGGVHDLRRRPAQGIKGGGCARAVRIAPGPATGRNAAGVCPAAAEAGRKDAGAGVVSAVAGLGVLVRFVGWWSRSEENSQSVS